MTTEDMTDPGSAISETAARVAAAAAVMFAALLTALHFIKPQLDPSWRVVSEYANGDHGWIMTLAFLSLALGCVALFVALRSEVRTVGGRIGLGFLLTTAIGLTIAAIFATDPITASKDDLTTHGNLHALGTALGVGFPIAAALISRSLTRRSERWFSIRRSLVWATGFVWIGLLSFALSVAIMLPQNDGEFGPSVLIGWPNRIWVLAYSVWLLVVARRAIELSNRSRLISSELAETMS